MEIDAISKLPSYKKLVVRRAKMIWSITGILILILLGNLYLMSLGSSIGNAPIHEGSVITVVVAYSIFVIFSGAFAAAFYVWWANRELDPLINEVTLDIETGS